MAKRTPQGKTKHDSGVQKVAEYYENKGYRVEADVTGFPSPSSINGRRPDVVAKNRKETVITEVETKDSLEKDRAQREVFQKYADSHENTRFRTKTV